MNDSKLLSTYHATPVGLKKFISGIGEFLSEKGMFDQGTRDADVVIYFSDTIQVGKGT